MKDIRIKTKLLILILVAFVPMFILHTYSISLKRQQAIDHELITSQEYAEAIGIVYINYLNRVWHSEFTIGNAIINNPNLAVSDINNYLKKCTSDEQVISTYMWINPKGVIISSSDPNQVGIDLSDRNYIKRIVNGEEKVVSNLLISKLNQRTCINISRGIRIGGELKGIVTAGIRSNSLGTILPENRLSVTSSFGLVDRSGKIVYRSGSPDIPLDNRQIKDDSPAWIALKGEVGLATNYHASFDNLSRIGANIPIKEIGWAAFASIESQEVLNKVNAEAVTSLVIMFSVMLVSLIIVAYLNIDLLKPIKTLQNAATAIGNRNFSLRTNLNRKDELGQIGIAFDKMADHVQELEEGRMLFLQAAAHELRNPMTSVKGISSIIYNRVTSGKPINNMLELIQTLNNEVSRLASLLNQILDAFWAERQNVQITTNLQPIDITEVVKSATRLYQMDTTNNRTIINPFSPPIWVLGDYDRLEDVIRNLISNAIKYSSDMTEIIINSKIEDRAVIVSVKDQGIGIPEDHLSKIFNSFHRVNNMNHQDPGGLGLGLYICKDIVLRHSGELWAENNIDGGSTFYIKLPIVET